MKQLSTLLALALSSGLLAQTPVLEWGHALVGQGNLTNYINAGSDVVVNATGHVTALAVGTTGLVIRGGTVETEVVVIVDAPSSPTSPVIAQVSPAVALPGTQLVLTGTGFSGAPLANVVLIDGTPVAVTSASTTQLVLALPPAASWPCEPTRTVALQVSTPGGIGVAGVMSSSKGTGARRRRFPHALARAAGRATQEMM